MLTINVKRYEMITNFQKMFNREDAHTVVTIKSLTAEG